jgi:hypothetical protein
MIEPTDPRWVLEAASDRRTATAQRAVVPSESPMVSCGDEPNRHVLLLSLRRRIDFPRDA